MLHANAFINIQQRILLCTAQELNDEGVGITVPDKDVEDAPSVVRVGVTPDTADPDEQHEGINISMYKWCVLRANAVINT